MVLHPPIHSEPLPALRAPVGPGGVSPGESFGLYLHVPFCATRCGYCDFNTYTAGELTGDAQASDVSGPIETWFTAVETELALAAARLGAPMVDTIFVGGGTPSLLGGAGLGRLLDAVRRYFPLRTGAEITTESNPESTSPEFFDRLLDAGYTRVSLGMQSAAAHVLRVLDRTHTPGRAGQAALEARAAGFEHVNLDLIYGTPGERDADLALTLDAVLNARVDHVSAYALIVEDGTAMARKVRRGELPRPDDDVLADRYAMIDERLRGAGFNWYEVSNWARTEAGQCRHNLGYWGGGTWWGIGPGAHSYAVGADGAGLRFANHKLPSRYAEALARQELPIAFLEELDADAEHLERLMLTIRTASGLPADALTAAERARARLEVQAGLLVPRRDAFALTDVGRLVADGILRRIVD